MTSKIALAAASGAAMLTLTVALAAAGFAPAPAAPASLTSTTTDPATRPTAAPTVLVDTIYVAPPAEPETITIRQTAPGGGEGEDGEHESGGDD